MGSGKTYLANYMTAKYRFPKASFAAPLKEDLERLGIEPEYLYDTKPDIIRILMQVYGQAHRFQDPDYWLKRGMSFADDLRKMAGGLPVVIDDVRFVNEADEIRRRGGIVVRVVNTRNLGLPGSDDISEIALDDYEHFQDMVVAGPGQLDLLQRKMDDILVSTGCIDG